MEGRMIVVILLVVACFRVDASTFVHTLHRNGIERCGDMLKPTTYIIEPHSDTVQLIIQRLGPQTVIQIYANHQSKLAAIHVRDGSYEQCNSFSNTKPNVKLYIEDHLCENQVGILQI